MAMPKRGMPVYLYGWNDSNYGKYCKPHIFCQGKIFAKVWKKLLAGSMHVAPHPDVISSPPIPGRKPSEKTFTYISDIAIMFPTSTMHRR
jgi:hypothetical protein